MRFNTQYDRVRQPAETNSGITLVERAGYISAQERIENLMLAGQRLVQARKEMYDFPDGKIDLNFSDPTRSKNYDLADGFQEGLKVEARLKAQKEAAEASRIAQEGLKVEARLKAQKEAVKASQTAKDGSNEPPEPQTGGE